MTFDLDPESFTATTVPKGARVMLVPRKEIGRDQADAFKQAILERWPDVDVIVISGCKAFVIVP